MGFFLPAAVTFRCHRTGFARLPGHGAGTETRERRRQSGSAAASVYQNGQMSFARTRSHLPNRSRTEMTTISGRPSWPQRAATRELRTTCLEQRFYRRCEQSAPALAVHAPQPSDSVIEPLPGVSDRVDGGDAPFPAGPDRLIVGTAARPVESPTPRGDA